MNRIIIILVCLGLASVTLKGQNPDSRAFYDRLVNQMDSGVAYLEFVQRKEDSQQGPITFKGEWPNKMGLRISFFLLGKKKPVDDSNCFAVTSIHNALAKVYLQYPEYKSIPSMLDLAYDNIQGYKNGDRYNFWRLHQPYRKLKKEDVIGQQPMVRRPTNYRLRTRYINNAANVVEDSDDTALAYIAMMLRSRIKNQVTSSDTIKLSGIFGQYRDTLRNNRHWYNYINGNDHNTGAFLTWLGEEYQFKRWNIVKVVGHNATFFLNFSECFPHAYVPYIPYGSNDLDGVVNANVLSALALNNELDVDGVSGSVKFIEHKASKRKYDRVGIYYPNRYQFPYAVSKAYDTGVKQLEESKKLIVANLLKNQKKDGSWKSRRIVNKKDRLQSTVYAVNALLNFGEMENETSRKAIQRGMNYIMDQASVQEDKLFWKGGVFFSGGTVVRNTLFWKSDAYTTAIVLTAYSKYRGYLEDNFGYKKN